MSDDGRKLLVGQTDMPAQLWPILPCLKAPAMLPCGAAVSAGEFSPSAVVLYSGSFDLLLWSPKRKPSAIRALSSREGVVEGPPSRAEMV